MTPEGTAAFAARKEQLLQQLNKPLLSEQFIEVQGVRFFKGKDEVGSFEASDLNLASRAIYWHAQKTSGQQEDERVRLSPTVHFTLRDFFGPELMHDTSKPHPAIEPLRDDEVTAFQLIMKEN